MITEHSDDIDRQFADALPIQQVDKAVVVFGNKYCYPIPGLGIRQTPTHIKSGGEQSKAFFEFSRGYAEAVELPLGAMKEDTLGHIDVLLCMHYVAAVPIDERGDFCH